MPMLKNYLKVALRNIKKAKMFSFITVSGLALGMSAFLLIAAFVRFERGYDRFHAKAKDIFLVVRDNRAAEYSESRTNTGAPLGPLLLENIPQVRQAVRFTLFRGNLVRRGETQFVEDKFFFADASALEVFDFPLVRGNPSTALREPFSVLLTGATAKKYFGSEDPMNQVLKYNLGGRVQDFLVTGILEDIPLQSHLDIDFLASYESLPALAGEWFMTSHWDSPTWNYVLLAPGSDLAAVESLLAEVTRSHVDRTSFDEIGHHLLALEDVYFKSPGPMPGPRGDASFLTVLSLIALFVLLIACFNFMNLSTSRSGARAAEIGLRKVVGARRGQLVGQFLGESVLHSFLALVLALGLVQLFLPAFNAFVGKPLVIRPFADLPFLALMVLAAAAVGVLAGSYPAFVLSSFRPVAVVRGKVEKGKTGAAVVRKFLVVGQFAISIGLIVVVAVVLKQVRFLRGMEVGFDKENLITIPIRDGEIRDRFDLLKSRWLQNPGVRAVTATSMVPGVGSPNGISMKARNAEDLDMTIVYVEQDYARTLGLTVAAGRDFSREIPTDAASGLLINRTLLDKLGWAPAGAVGEPVELYFKEGGRIVPVYETTVVGVVEDFHFRDLLTGLQPILLKIEPRRYQHILIRTGGGRSREILEDLKKTWDGFQFKQAFEFTYLADDIDAVLRPIESFGGVTRNAAILAVLIACLGLFGLASFTIERRTKEIGIRKVLGASVGGLVGLVTRDFLLLVAAANLVAWPAAYYSAGVFLRNFPHKTALSLWIFLLAGCLAFAVALLTVIVQSARAALADPVESLRYE
jgi:putative ABC transport system permease protein